MGGGGSVPPAVEIDQCEVMDDTLKEEYGDDFLTNREKFPITSQALGYLAATPCESYFGYEDLVREYCTNVDNYTEQIGNGQTCADKTDTSMRSRWCLMDDEGQEAGRGSRQMENVQKISWGICIIRLQHPTARPTQMMIGVYVTI
jgi:hypothetical protein